MSVLNKLTRDFKFKLKETIKEKQDFYLNLIGLMYKKKLPLSKDDLSYETVLTRLDTKLYYIFSKAKKEIEERETKWLKLGVFIDWFYKEKGIYMTSFKSFCFNDDNILHKYICYVEGLADGGNAFKDEDKHRKIRFMIYEHVTYGEDSDDNEEEEEEEGQPRELDEQEQESESEDEGLPQANEQEMVETYNNRDIEFIGRRARAYEIVQVGDFEEPQNFSKVLLEASNPDIDRFEESDAGYFWLDRRRDFRTGEYIISYSGRGIERIERFERIDEELQQSNTSQPQKTFYEEKCVICLEEKPDILFSNCGHICVCTNCDDLNENSNKCPVCKTKSVIKNKL